MNTKLLTAAAALLMSVVWPALAADVSPQALTSINEMMNRIVRPTSDVVFYVAAEAPASDEAWLNVENSALTLAESANLLLMSGYVRPGERWAQDVAAMREAALAAFEAAKNRDVSLLEELGNTLYESCESCHTANR
ncbi:MAG TPA: hypothetical protein VKZ92_02100 [Pseudohongiella sp.]|nr:hypothetical protein [Pseudohongiella sp.]